MHKEIIFVEKESDALSSIVYVKNDTTYMSNPFAEGERGCYICKYSGDYELKLEFAKGNTSEAEVFSTPIKHTTSSTANELLVFDIDAPDPNVYPYIKGWTSRTGSTGIGISLRRYLMGWKEHDGASAGVARSGNSASKPISNDIYEGFMYFDSQINKPIYAKELSDTGAVTWVDSEGTVVSYQVINNLTNITSNGLLTAAAGQSYVTTLTAADGYTLPTTITIKIGSTTLTENTGYTYDQSTGAVEVLGTDGTSGVTDALTITATATST